VVLDEWSYLDGKKGSNNSPAPILRLQAEKKWILSGTPPLRDFVDVKRMASFLGVDLGVDSFSSGPVTSQKWKTHRMDHTPAEQFNAFREVRTLTWHEDRHSRAQGFLDQFVRQNDAEIGEIRCIETIVPFELRSDQRAVYLELLQHLKSNEMQVKSLGNNKSDRNERMRQALGKGKTPEEALLNCAAYFSGKGGLRNLLNIRDKQLDSTKKDLKKILIRAASFKKSVGDSDVHYGQWRTSVLQRQNPDDAEVDQMLRLWVQQAEQSSVRGKPTDDDGNNEDGSNNGILKLRQMVIGLRGLARELLSRTRSRRYIDGILGLQKSSLASGEHAGCDEGDCSRAATCVISACGHVSCLHCLEVRAHDACIADGCKATVKDYHIDSQDDLGSDDDTVEEDSFGKRFDMILDLLEGIPTADQAIVFVQDLNIMALVSQALDTRNITHHAIDGGSHAAKSIEDFQSNASLSSRKKVLLLNVSDASAAGLNLTNANHVLFVSPLLVESQYKYESAMVQAIGRCRRYGQEKVVRVYRFVGVGTVDVNVLEQRERRGAAVLEVGHPDVGEGRAVEGVESSVALAMMAWKKKRERTKLVRRSDGYLGLVPLSLLTEAEQSQHLESTMEFSANFREEDEEDGDE